jgi:hypothetical protein
MYDLPTRRHAMSLIAQGQSLSHVSRATGIARATMRDWLYHPEKLSPSRMIMCLRCSGKPAALGSRGDYAYLFGLYLGDGCISRQGPGSKGVWKLRIMCADAWPDGRVQAGNAGCASGQHHASGQIR